MTSIFLPDFVGYPLCYLALQAQLPQDAGAVFVDYNAHWPYASLPRLVDAIASTLVLEAPDTIVGYSFGAHAAVLLAERLYSANKTPKLVLIDPPVLAAIPRRDAATIESLLRSHGEYRYIFDAIDCNLTSLECMVANIEMLSQLPARRRLHGPVTLFVAGNPVVARAVLGELEAAVDVPELICLEHCNHRSILRDPVVSERLLLVATASADR